jgi:septum formation protein
VLATLAELPPPDRLAALALAKATAVAERLEGAPAVVLGCDSMLELDGVLLGKPHDAGTALDRWQSMSGRAGILHTGHAVLRCAHGWIRHSAGGTRSTTVRFADVSDQERSAYVGTGEPLEVAGAFTLDGYGGWFVESIEGDPSNVLGISLPLVRELLTEVGLSVFEMWNPGVPEMPA